MISLTHIKKVLPGGMTPFEGRNTAEIHKFQKKNFGGSTSKIFRGEIYVKRKKNNNF